MTGIKPMIGSEIQDKTKWCSAKEGKNDCTSKAPGYCHRNLKKLIQTLKRRKDVRGQDAWHRQGAHSPLAAPNQAWHHGRADGECARQIWRFSVNNKCISLFNSEYKGTGQN